MIAALALLSELAGYRPHADGGFLATVISGAALGTALCMMGLSVMTSIRARQAGWMEWMIMGITVLACAGIFVLARRIPLCPVCDGITAEELGILARWIGTGH